MNDRFIFSIHKIISNMKKYDGGSRNGSQVTWPTILINKYPDKRNRYNICFIIINVH